MKISIRLLLSIAISILFLTQISAARPIFPSVGVAYPLGTTGDNWETGFMLGLQFPLKNTRHGDWSIVASFQQSNPNADEMLKTDGRELKIQSSDGLSRHYELGILGGKTLWKTSTGATSFALQYGAGIFLIDDEDIHLKGVYQTTSAALTREIFKESDAVVVPGVTLGGVINTKVGASLSMGLKHIFTAGETRDYVIFEIGIQPH